MHEVAILGAGLISSLHIEAYLALSERCRIAAVVDVEEEKARAQVDRYGLDARVLTDYHALEHDDSIDLVSVCVPPFRHAELASAMLSGGKHVLLEKPMAPSLAECDDIITGAEAAGRLVSVVAQKRFDAEVMRAKSLIDEGRLGRLLHGQADSFWWRGNAYYEVPWRGKWETEGGGCVFIHAVHHLDLLQWFMGMPERVSAVVENVAHPSSEVEDLAAATLSYDAGRLAQVTASLVHHGERQRISFEGERAGLAVPWELRANTADEKGFPMAVPEVEAELQEARRAARENAPAPAGPLEHVGHAGQIADLLDAVETGGTPLCDGVQGRNAIELITAIYASAEEGRPVELPLSRKHGFYAPGATQERMARFMSRK